MLPTETPSIVQNNSRMSLAKALTIFNWSGVNAWSGGLFGDVVPLNMGRKIDVPSSTDRKIEVPAGMVVAT